MCEVTSDCSWCLGLKLHQLSLAGEWTQPRAEMKFEIEIQYLTGEVGADTTETCDGCAVISDGIPVAG